MDTSKSRIGFAFVPLVVLALSGLAGCASMRAQEDQARLQAINDQRVEAFHREAGAIFDAVKAKKTLPEKGIAAVHDLCVRFGTGPLVEETWMYRIMLIERVQLGELTRTQAAYMDTQKVAEMTERERVADAAEQQRYDQEQSNNMSCVTIPLNWGGSVTKCH